MSTSAARPRHCYSVNLRNLYNAEVGIVGRGADVRVHMTAMSRHMKLIYLVATQSRQGAKQGKWTETNSVNGEKKITIIIFVC